MRVMTVNVIGNVYFFLLFGVVVVLSSLPCVLSMSLLSSNNKKSVSSGSNGGSSGSINTCTTNNNVNNNNKMTSSIMLLTLGGSQMRSLVQDASYRDIYSNSNSDDDSNNDYSNLNLNGIFWMEHVNLIVGSDSLAKYFYLDLLGFTRDNSGKSFHINLGQQQFHLKETRNLGNTNNDNDDNDDDNDDNDDRIQTIAGSIGLAVPNLQTLKQRLKEAAALSIFQIINDTTNENGNENENNNNTNDNEDLPYLTIRGPWGNIFHIYDIRDDDRFIIPSELSSSSPQKMTMMHAPGGAYGYHRMAVRGQPGIRYLEIACPFGKSPSIAQFYRQLLGCTVHEIQSSSSSSTTASALTATATATAVVNVGPGVHLAFVEQQQEQEQQEEQEQQHQDYLQQAYKAMKGVHVCFYVDSFYELYHELKSKNLIWTNPRFVHLDTCDTWEEAKASFTFRFKDIIDLQTGEKILELEHETRPLRHGQYLKVPNYEPK